MPHQDREDRAQMLLDRLVDQMTRGDPQLDAAWERTFRRIRRDPFVPRFYVRDSNGEQRLVTSKDDDWLELVYRNDSLFTSLESRSLSSSSMPGVMAVFLRLLDVQASQDVLEIGTATGYNAALLCDRLGAEHVTSVDVEARYVEDARTRLAAHYGFRPTLVVGDGALGYPPRAPYDRIVVTCGISKVPDAWLDQLKPGGVIVAPLQYHPRLYNGQLMTLRRQADGSLLGSGDKMGVGFMPLRSATLPIYDPDQSAVVAYATSAQGGVARAIEFPTWFTNGGAAVVLCKLQYPGLEIGVVEDAVTGTYPPVLANFINDSWARVRPSSDGSTTVEQGGSARLWDELEQTRDLWHKLGSPWLDRYGMTITRNRRQFVWLDSPDSQYCWEL